MDCIETEKEYKTCKTGKPARGCGPRRVSRSAYEYLRLKAEREGDGMIAGMFFNTVNRYGEKTTLTTRRTSHDSDHRKTY